MKGLYLKQLNVNDGIDVYEMLQRIGSNENEFKNTANGLTLKDFKEWLTIQDAWSRGEHLPFGYVPQTIYWLYNDDIVVGFGKIRHQLNSNSRHIGGNIGYAIDPLFRGKGFASVLLRELIQQAKNMKIEEIWLTVEKYNPASKRVIEKAGGILQSETDERWYFSF